MSLNLSSDILEDLIVDMDYNLMCILLKDNTTGKNILWATDDYISYGDDYSFSREIKVEQITKKRGNIIKPRVIKKIREQKVRVKDKAEVFTPSWVCNEQNNLVDNSWFGKKNIFNNTTNKSWKTIKRKIKFPDDKDWQDYVKLKRMEICCGEAPYLVSRYDTVSGNIIEVCDRIGILDRKLRVINENVSLEDEWIKWTEVAYKSVYGYEWQGDSLLIARENLLFTFIDNYIYKFNKNPDLKYLLEIANIISFNIWQMDGVKFVVPNSCQNDRVVDHTLFGDIVTENYCPGCRKNKIKEHNGIYCKIMNWDTKRKIKFISLITRRKKNEKK